MTTFLVTTSDASECDPDDIRDGISAWMDAGKDVKTDVAVEQIEVIHQPEAAGGEGQVGLIYRVLDAA